MLEGAVPLNPMTSLFSLLLIYRCLTKQLLHGSIHIACILLLIAGVGCSSSGTNFDQSKTAQIKKGETTEADLVQLFGAPEGRTISSDGQTTLTWSYMESRAKGESFIPVAGAFLGGHKSSHKMLMVTIGPDGKVQSFNSSTGGSEYLQNRVQETPK